MCLFTMNIFFFTLTLIQGKVLWHIWTSFIALQHWLLCSMSSFYHEQRSSFVVSLPFTAGWFKSVVWVDTLYHYTYPRGTVFRVTGQGERQERTRWDRGKNWWGIGGFEVGCIWREPLYTFTRPIHKYWESEAHRYVQDESQGWNVESWRRVAKTLHRLHKDGQSY